MTDLNNSGDEQLEQERWDFLQQLEEWLETPLIVLAFVWLLLLLIEFIWGLVPILQLMVNVIWIIFILDFLLRFILAPQKLNYLKGNWLTAISLFLPALRIFRLARTLRLLRLARATRSLRLVRVVSSLNRGMRALRASMSRRGFGYAIVLSLLVLLVGAAGMYAVEGDATGTPAFATYGDALWWTGMLLTTIGAEGAPQTAEGRLLTFLLSVYALAVLGYVTASLASFFIGRDAESETGELPGTRTVEALQAEITALRLEVQRLSQISQRLSPDE